MLQVVTEAVPTSLAKYVSDIQGILIELMSSSLAAPVVLPLYINLKNCVFEPELRHLGECSHFVHVNSIYLMCSSR